MYLAEGLTTGKGQPCKTPERVLKAKMAAVLQRG